MTPEQLARLKQSLAELNDELARIDPADENARALLSGALDEIQGTLNQRQAGHAGHVDAGLSTRLTSAAREFEETDPQLSGLLGSVIDALSRMGI